MPAASVIKWCLLPALRLLTGLGPVLEPPKQPVLERSRPPRATNRSGRPRAALRAAARAAAARRPPAATRRSDSDPDTGNAAAPSGSAARPAPTTRQRPTAAPSPHPFLRGGRRLLRYRDTGPCISLDALRLRLTNFLRLS